MATLSAFFVGGFRLSKIDASSQFSNTDNIDARGNAIVFQRRGLRKLGIEESQSYIGVERKRLCVWAGGQLFPVALWVAKTPILDRQPSQIKSHRRLGRARGLIRERRFHDCRWQYRRYPLLQNRAKNCSVHPSALSTFRLTAITSGPMPSPGRTANLCVFMI